MVFIFWGLFGRRMQELFPAAVPVSEKLEVLSLLRGTLGCLRTGA